ncbi:MAG: hypothetical protein RBS07_17005 [Lentimicrobium sp.]|jgi:hypothetical protein|nr:hypothetical protein [Lentimicrobium sp.]
MKQRMYKVVKMQRNDITYLKNIDQIEEFYVFEPEKQQHKIEERIYTEKEIKIEGRYAYYHPLSRADSLLVKSKRLRSGLLAASMK